MTVLMIACSKRAFQLMQKLEQKWKTAEPELNILCKVKCSSLPDVSEKVSLSECVGEWFAKVDAIVFLCAAGIAVRSIAPYIKHKSTDPAVVVVDETGKFSISLLSGHMGGANELAERIGMLLNAVPVITTATDREYKFAVDDFARKNQMVVTDWKMAKRISVHILNGEQVGIWSDLPIAGNMPKELFLYEPIAGNASKHIEERAHQAIIRISYHKQETPLPGEMLQLVPRVLVAGIGCRKGIPEEKIDDAVECCLMEEKIMPEAVCAVASIDLKKQEKGLLDYCEKKRLPFLTYTAGELKQVEGKFTDSVFVEQVTGVAGVCERSAVAATGGKLLCNKKVYDGVTVAIAERKGSVDF